MGIKKEDEPPAHPLNHYSLFTTHYSLLTILYSLLTIHYSLFTIHYSLFSTHYSLLSTLYSHAEPVNQPRSSIALTTRSMATM
ncbi:MAG: hypothetical protein DCC59_04280 [Chloroflexi bacterium]|nr:MAG: hypothetical protein DCC59_04280 [Chloroflexota bacterium]